MSAISIDLGGGSNSFQYQQPGDWVTGKIIAVESVQQTDLDSGKPAFWEGGQPKLMIRVELATELKEDENDDGNRSVYLKGSRKPESMSSMAAVLAAVRKATGGSEMAVGALLTLTYAEDGTPTKRGWNAPKHYTAAYTPPKVELSPPIEDTRPSF